MSFLGKWFDAGARFEKNYAQKFLARYRAMPWPGDWQLDLENQYVDVRGLRVAVAREKRLLITGELGSGKTSALTHLGLMHARNLLSANHPPRFPVFISVRDYRASALPNADAAIRALVPDAPREYLTQLLASERALILIDDLDAMPSAARADWLMQFGGAQIIASASAALTGWSEFSLPGLRDNDLDEFSQAHLGKTKHAAFATALKASGVPRSLTASPLMMTLLEKIWESDHTASASNAHAEMFDTLGIKALPARRADLFSAYAQFILRDDDETAHMLEGVALAMQRGKPAPNDFLNQSRGFLRAAKNQTGDTFTSFSARFVHDLWQAYFAARALRHAPDLEPLLEKIADPNWFQVILFYAGLGDAQPLLDALIARSDFVLAGFVLAQAKDFPAETRESVTADLMERAWNGDARAIAALSEMHSEIAVDWLASRLKDKDAAVRMRAVEILGQLQLDRGIDYLLPQLRDISRDVRDKVVEALGRARTDRVVEPLLVALRGDPRVGTIDTRLRIAAAKALGQVATEKAFAALIVDLQNGEPEVREVAAESLKRIKTPLMLKPLHSILQTGDPLARKYAEEVLAIVDGASPQ